VSALLLRLIRAQAHSACRALTVLALNVNKLTGEHFFDQIVRLETIS
jgi:hypothetical protein